MRGMRVAFTVSLLIAATIAASTALPAGEPDPWKVYPDGLPERANALRFNIDACVAACRQHADPAASRDWEAAKDDLAVALREAIGLEPWPEKTPLEAQVTGRAEREGYTIENVVFQSFPGFYVTANVYVPADAARPLPAVVVTAGHAMEEGKNYDVYRSAQLGLVRQGFLVLAYDPLGQGERKLPGYSHTVSYPAMLVGHTNLRYMLWDSVRALDYLLTRPDVDPERIGIAGNSGGGLNTMYAMPVEPRFAAGASFCCLCSFEAWIKDGGNHCICNHLPGICHSMEQFQFVGLCSPRPFLTGNGEKDRSFPIEGTRDTIRRAQKIYALDDAADRVALREVPLGHGWSQPLREAAYGWLNRWLQNRGDGSPVAETEIRLEDKNSKDLRVFKDGKLPAGAKSYVDLVREEAQRLVRGYERVPSEAAAYAAWAGKLRERLWETVGGRPDAVEPSLEEHGSFDWEGKSVRRLAIRTEANLEVPALLIRGGKPEGRLPAVIVLDAAGKQAAAQSPVVRRLLGKPVAVLALDVRALGEGKVPENQCASDAVALGRPLLAQQAWDVIAAARALSAREDLRPIAVYGRGSAGLIAMLAAALSDEIGAVAVERSPGSLVETIADPLPQPLWAYAPNLLKVADLPQLAALCAPRPLLWAEPIGAAGKVGSEAEGKMLFEPVLAGYRATASRTSPALVSGGTTEQAIGDFLVNLAH